MDGFLNVLKPRLFTSHDVVFIARRLTREDRLGHLGTLDPLAVGVLPLACGRYRRLSEFFLGEDKRYLAEFTFGVRTDTGDTDGLVVEVKDASRVKPEQVEEALRRYTGNILQVPPAYSALKVKGKKMLNLARKGIEPEREAREVRVQEFKLAGWIPGERPKGIFSLRVGRGTYVRALAFSLGDDLGCGATVSYLLRERSGKFLLRDSVTLETLKRLSREGRIAEALCDPVSVMPDYPAFMLAPGAALKVSHGVALSAADVTPAPGREFPAAFSEGPFPFRAIALTGDKAPQAGPGVAAIVLFKAPGAISYEKVMIAE